MIVKWTSDELKYHRERFNKRKKERLPVFIGDEKKSDFIENEKKNDKPDTKKPRTPKAEGL